MEQSFRKSMTWLHTWSGLILGWLLFAIFVTGTSAYYRGEINLWMQPETHKSIVSDNTLTLAVEKSIEATKTSSNVSVGLPGDRTNLISIRAIPDPASQINRSRVPRGADKKTNISKEHGAKKQEPAKNIRHFRRVAPTYYDATTGEAIKPRETAGGNFLYRFHYELYGIPRDIARWIVGIATMSMFVAIITGIIIHKRIFKDIFTFRAKTNPRGWMDAHILPAVATLPFLIMITYSGLLLFTNTLMPWGMKLYYDDFREYRQDMFALRSNSTQKDTSIPKTITVEKSKRDFRVEANNSQITKEDLLRVLDEANKYWPNNIGYYTINKNKTTNSFEVEVRPKDASNIFNWKGEKESIVFDAKSAQVLKITDTPTSDNIILNTNTTFTTLHFAHFADSTLRFVFFISGLFGVILSATGLILWIEKRKKKYEDKKSIGFWLVEKLNIGTIVGLFIAIAIYFIANRVIPALAEDRRSLEISAFFIAWLITYIYGFVRDTKKAWIEQFALASILHLSIPILNNLVWVKDIGFFERDSIFIYFDIYCLVAAFTFSMIAYILNKKSKKGE